MAYPMPAALAAQKRRFEAFLGHPLHRWEWRTTRAEDEVTAGIWALLSPRDPLLAAGVTRAFLAPLPAPLVRTLTPAVPLRGWLLNRTYGPDLLLADADAVVRVVVEHKRGANAQVTALRTVGDAGPMFPDPLARHAWAEVTATHQDQPHRPPSRDLNDFACCWAHTQPSRTGLVNAGMWQIDAYRCSRGWAADTELTVPTDPRQIGWVLLDTRGRSAGQVYDGALTATEWHTLSHARLAEQLLDWLTGPGTSTQSYSGGPSPLYGQVVDALRMLFTDGPGDRDRWHTEPAARPSGR